VRARAHPTQIADEVYSDSNASTRVAFQRDWIDAFLVKIHRKPLKACFFEHVS
jgi:hypothetical protein